jgi:hypothetical protein
MQWDTAPKFASNTFLFVPPAGALPMALGKGYDPLQQPPKSQPPQAAKSKPKN